MILIIREYLSMLKESGELDALLTDLIMSMDMKPLSKPQKGARQYGVDLAAIGLDPDDDAEKLFLFVIKQGNINRNTWDGQQQSVRESLNEINDVYLSSMLDKSLQKKRKKIILCSNGDLAQNVRANWVGFKEDKSKHNEIEYDFWGGDALSALVEKYLLNEFLFPELVQKQMRKTLAFLDLDDYDLTHFYQLIEELLFNRDLSKKDQLKILRLLNLCLNLVFHWAQEANNLKPALLASERLVLRVWDWMRPKSLFLNKKIFREFCKIFITQTKIYGNYFKKIQKHCYIEDGLYGYRAEQIEYPLLTFEQIGILGIAGFEFLNHSAMKHEGNKIVVPENVSIVTDSLANLIHNNKSSYNPLFDGHVIDICLGLLLLNFANRKGEAEQWLSSLFQSIILNYKLRKKFPILSDSYEDLVDIEVESTYTNFEASTLLSVMFEWCVVLNLPNGYRNARDSVISTFPDVNLQTWYPDEDIEQYMYKGNALVESGSMRHSILLPDDFNNFKKQILEELKREEHPDKLSFIINGMPIIGLIASRHFRTPVFPFFWRAYIQNEQK